MLKYVAIAAVALALGGCAGYPGSGPFVGGVVGGATGAGVGASLCGYNPACMVIGSVVGAMAGGAVGQSVEQTRYPPPPPYYGAPSPYGYAPAPQPRPNLAYGQQPGTVYVPGADPAADAAYQSGRAAYWNGLNKNRQAAAWAAGYKGY